MGHFPYRYSFYGGSLKNYRNYFLGGKYHIFCVRYAQHDTTSVNSGGIKSDHSIVHTVWHHDHHRQDTLPPHSKSYWTLRPSFLGFCYYPFSHRGPSWSWCMVVGFITIYAFSAYHHSSCEFEPHSWRGVLDTTLCDKVCKWLAAGRGFLWVLRFTPSIKLTAMI